MSTHILIIGGGLAGLTTAYRLNAMGFRVSIVDKRLSGKGDFPESSSPFADPFESERGFPFILHGYESKVSGLLHELGTDFFFQSEIPVTVEFLGSAGKTEDFRSFPVPPPFHTLLRLLTFRSLSIRDRWSLINMVERYWEGATEFPQDFKTHTSDTWVNSLGQSTRGCQNVWNPLCQFLLGDSLAQSSANDFKEILVKKFLTSRRNSETWLPTQDETSLLLNPLRSRLQQQGVEWHPQKEVIQFQDNGLRLTGVVLQDGTTMNADGYVGAIPPKALLPCLPERLLARYSYFCGLANLRYTPALLVHLEFALPTSQPRLILSPQPFHWMTSRPQSRSQRPTTLISCVVTGHHELFHESDPQILKRASEIVQCRFHPRHSKGMSNLLQSQVHRIPQYQLSPHPSQTTQRPLQQSPYDNFFLAGPYTDTGQPATRESSILSAMLCAHSIANSPLHQNIDNLILQS